MLNVGGRFRGQIASGRDKFDAEFSAWIDEDGEVRLNLAPLRKTARTAVLLAGDDVRDDEPMMLEGMSSDGDAFRSSSLFVIDHEVVSDDMGSAHLSLRCACDDAEITRVRPDAPDSHQLLWFFRRLASSQLSYQTADGLVWTAGAQPLDDEPQRLSGAIAIWGDGEADSAWFHAADAWLGHVACVMSLATGVDLQPRVERRVDGALEVWRVNICSPAHEPSHPPFPAADIEKAFLRACGMAPDQRRLFAELDAVGRTKLLLGD